MKKYNIIFFFSDQQRWDTCGCYGQKLNVTPHLDAMAKEGVLFENAYTCQPVCGPARSCLQTGKYATETGCYRNDIGLLQDEKTIAHHFQENGYRTGYIGKWHLASTNSNDSDAALYSSSDKKTAVYDSKNAKEMNSAKFNRRPSVDFHKAPVPIPYRGGWKDQWIVSDVLEFTSHGYDGYMFDKDNNKKFFPEGRYRPDAQTDWVLDTLEDWSKSPEDPFFLFVSYIEPHHQNDHNRYEGPEGSKETFGNYEIPGDLKGHAGDWEENYPDYLGAINSLDKNLGRIRNKLQECGISENTIIIYGSDHGSHFRTRNNEYKRSCHQASTHVPLVIYHPDKSHGVRISNMISLIDLPATFLALTGIDRPYTFKGRSLKPFIEKGEDLEDWDDVVFLQISESQIGRAVRTKRWCYCVTAQDGDPWNDMDSDVYQEAYLYDLYNDPHERNNIVHEEQYNDVKKKLRKKLLEKMQEAGEQLPSITTV
ncbi:MAG: sulfatase-like hydrolase/transferase [Spirochaetia bacterium]|nr:sulfatase-like hydrolase/transferase [Spirochaetia bacterium]